MSKETMTTQKHLTLDCRIAIEKGLDKRMSLRKIADQLCKDPSTISKEIKKHRISQPHNTFMESNNKCSKAKDCTKKNICDLYAPKCKRACRFCNLCNSHCSDFERKSYLCPKLDKAPFTCNGCNRKSACRLDKSYYRATTAHRQYKTLLVESRTGINISEDDCILLDELITPLVLRGHSPYMILQNHPEIKLCEKTIYNYIDSGAFSVKNIDLPKKVKYKVRKTGDAGKDIDDTGDFEGRTYKDFQAFLKEYPDTGVVEMDTVLGCEGSRKILLTLHFQQCSLMLAFLLESKESKYVEALFNDLEEAMTSMVFAQTFPLILTDRGGEFRHAQKLECSSDNFIRTSIYYCDPMCSWQKPHCEKNHVYIRKICPKGTSFDNMTQKEISLIMSHINSSPRESLGGLTPLALARLMLPKKLFDFCHVLEIAPDSVILTPELLEK